MKLIDYKLESGLSFTDIAKATGFHRTSIFQFIKHPEVTGISTVLKIAAVIGMPEEEAKTQWLECKYDNRK